MSQKWLQDLNKKRLNTSIVLNDFAVESIKDILTENYSEEAHFIYELLQNADDVKATRAEFELLKDKLIFKHNGTRHFSITDPATEKQDKLAGKKVGDINSITAYGQSTKKSTDNSDSDKTIFEPTIGKFGIGFKSVFQYTEMPEIWDRDYSFRIEDYIVPVPLNGECPYKKSPDETLFVFPLGTKNIKLLDAFEDIKGKLQGLSFPLLFLLHLNEITFKIGDFQGFYKKNITATTQHGDITEEQIKFLENQMGTDTEWNFLIFSRQHSSGKYCIGYFLENEKLTPIVKNAFCFFPTKETTGLNFIIHAPFLLANSRDNIRSNKSHNHELIELLAELAADSLPILRDQNLIDDDIVKIIPVTENSKALFSPFYDKIKSAMQTQALIPAFDSVNSKYNFVKSENAYWAQYIELTKVFSNKQLAEIVPNPNAAWVFTSMPRSTTDSDIKSYINDITKTYLNEETILTGRNYWNQRNNIRGITAGFIEKQTFEWIHQFYKWLSKTTDRTDAAKTLPLFLDKNRNAVPAFKNDLPNLFLPLVGGSNYPTVHSDLLANSDTKVFLTEKIGIKEPSIKDEIYTKVFPQYDKFTEYSTEDDSSYFQKIFKYYRNLPNWQLNKYIEDLKKHLWLRCFSPKSSNYTKTYSRPQYILDTYPKYALHKIEVNLYIPSDEITEYFDAAGCGRFVDLDFYLNLVGQDKKTELIKFFKELGIVEEVQYFEVELELYQKNCWGNLNRLYQENYLEVPKDYSTRENERKWKEYRIEGCYELLEKIIKSQNPDDAYQKSLILWNRLIALNKVEKLRDKLRGRYEYFYYQKQYKYFEAITLQFMKNEKWLKDKSGNFKSVEEITLQDIADDYDIVSYDAREIIDFLGINEEPAPPVQPEDDPNLSDEQRDLIKYGKLIEAAVANGLTLEEIEQFLKQPKFQSIKGAESDTANKTVNRTTSDENSGENSGENSEVQETEEKFEPPKPKITRPPLKTQEEISKVIDAEQDERNKFRDNDNDEWTPPTVDYQKKIERLKKKSEEEQEQLLQLAEMQQQVQDSEKYSYGWFKACLELELWNSNENRISSREISISFGRVEKEPNTPRTLILKYPSRFIPQFMEDLENISLNLRTKNAPAKEVIIEVISVQHNTLRVKLKDGAQVENVNLAEVIEATINAKNPVFLLEELKKQFQNLNYADDFNMQKNLCENIEFVFGPPGTGKTTYLAREVILPLMQLPEYKKILVLTPTNKAADVITKKIMDLTDNFEWLIRFGTTHDADIEEKVFYEKTFDIYKKPRNVTVTTIARFPYDYFMIDNKRSYLHELKWDYIIIDEASMIPLINIILPLYMKTPEKFIIAGDPFQIEPIISCDFWKDKNIYTLVELNSFTASKTVPHDYKVIKLMTQYRSLPSVGEVFSKLTYGGKLNHNRAENQKLQLNIENWLNIKSLNIIKFPVSKYESVYRAKQINSSSSYQTYSAIFTFEFVKEMSIQISKNNPTEKFSIGIIAPYRVQANLLEKLFATAQIPPNIQISASTIHGFQGDECNIIFAVFNSPPSITQNIFLNRQNIINVAISRASDYLFLVMPDDNTEKVENLWLIKKVENLFGKEGYSEFSSAEIEKLIFGTENYIEDNSFSTGHQNVNIYTEPERIYEIRSDDNAVDIQIHKDYIPSELKTNLQDTPTIEHFANDQITDDSTLTQETPSYEESTTHTTDEPNTDDSVSNSQDKDVLKVEYIPNTNLTWTLDDSGTLTISGNGDMLHEGWGTIEKNTWANKRYLIHKGIIESGVTSIGDFAFNGEYGNLQEIQIADGVKKIGWRAFQYCGNLKKIELPDSIEEISGHAFFYCKYLEEISLPFNLVTIGKCAFRGCYHLEKIKFSPNIQQIDDEAFSACQCLKEVTLPPSIKKIGHNVFGECSCLEVIKYPRGLRSAEKLGEGNNAELIPY